MRGAQDWSAYTGVDPRAAGSPCDGRTVYSVYTRAGERVDPRAVAKMPVWCDAWRSIPACGEPLCPCCFWPVAVDPRARGAILKLICPDRFDLVDPRVREPHITGDRTGAFHIILVMGSIPARAGSPMSQLEGRVIERVDPRAGARRLHIRLLCICSPGSIPACEGGLGRQGYSGIGVDPACGEPKPSYLAYGRSPRAGGAVRR